MQTRGNELWLFGGSLLVFRQWLPVLHFADSIGGELLCNIHLTETTALLSFGKTRGATREHMVGWTYVANAIEPIEWQRPIMLVVESFEVER